MAASKPESNRMLLIGLGAGFVLYALILAFSVLIGLDGQGYDDQGYWALNLIGFMLVVTLLVLIAGLVMVFMPKTRKLGAGLLISIAVGLFVDGGTCVALLAARA